MEGNQEEGEQETRKPGKSPRNTPSTRKEKATSLWRPFASLAGNAFSFASLSSVGRRGLTIKNVARLAASKNLPQKTRFVWIVVHKGECGTENGIWAAGRGASWTAAVPCRFSDQCAGASARGLAQSKTLHASDRLLHFHGLWRRVRHEVCPENPPRSGPCSRSRFSFLVAPRTAGRLSHFWDTPIPRAKQCCRCHVVGAVRVDRQRD